MSSVLPVKVGDVIHRLFPGGTRSQVVAPDDRLSPPDFPPDLFAAAAHLLHLGGAYHYLVPHGEAGDWPPTCVCVHRDELESWRDAGEAWKARPAVPSLVSDIWAKLVAERDEPVYREPVNHMPAPTWWKHAHALLIIADEACADIGYVNARSSGAANENWVVDMLYAAMFSMYAQSSGSAHIRIRPQAASICLQVDRDVVCVQPKARTPEVGCTLRTLSHNLCLLPPRGVMRAHWQRPPFDPLPEPGTTLNILLVPLPYSIDPQWFEHHSVTSATKVRKGVNPPGWGWFDISQKWLSDEILDFTMKLLAEARKTCVNVHGLVFPEFALDWSTYEKLAARLRSETRDLEFLVAGSSTNCNGESGNFALSSQFFQIEDDDGRAERVVATTSRPKHHRWRLDPAQISTYDLGRALPKNGHLWERINLPQREIHVNVVRKSSVFTTMICEDLARSDPCHEVLRSIGPNLVIALLMDGPQLHARWPGRYATVLADDPGSSVLTFSSRALIERSNKKRNVPNWTVALWKDDSGTTTEIECPPGQHGVVLVLNAEPVVEMTLDGRANAESFAWRLKLKPQCVALDESEPTVATVLGRD